MVNAILEPPSKYSTPFPKGRFFELLNKENGSSSRQKVRKLYF